MTIRSLQPSNFSRRDAARERMGPLATLPVFYRLKDKKALVLASHSGFPLESRHPLLRPHPLMDCESRVRGPITKPDDVRWRGLLTRSLS